MNPLSRVSGGWTWLASRSAHWKVVVGCVLALALAVGAWRATSTPPAPITVIEMAPGQELTPGGTPVADTPPSTQPTCRNPFGTEALPFELTPDAERMIGADPTGTVTDPCVAASLAWELLLATPVESANAAGKVCSARLVVVPWDTGDAGGEPHITFDPDKGTRLLDCSAKAGTVQVPDGGRLPTVTTVAPVGGQ